MISHQSSTMSFDTSFSQLQSFVWFMSVRLRTNTAGTIVLSHPLVTSVLPNFLNAQQNAVQKKTGNANTWNADECGRERTVDSTKIDDSQQSSNSRSIERQRAAFSWLPGSHSTIWSLQLAGCAHWLALSDATYWRAFACSLIQSCSQRTGLLFYALSLLLQPNNRFHPRGNRRVAPRRTPGRAAVRTVRPPSVR